LPFEKVSVIGKLKKTAIARLDFMEIISTGLMHKKIAQDFCKETSPQHNQGNGRSDSESAQDERDGQSKDGRVLRVSGTQQLR
jgi:hypothetical protein